MFSSETDLWSTPQDFYDELNSEFCFTLDSCANDKNHKCPKYFTKEQNGLLQDWSGNSVFCNPPYGRNSTGKWVEKAYNESNKPDTVCVMLIPARTDTKWFHRYIYDGKANNFRDGVTVRFIKGRLKFGGSKNSAPFPSMIVIFDKRTLKR